MHSKTIQNSFYEFLIECIYVRIKLEFGIEGNIYIFASIPNSNFILYICSLHQDYHCDFLFCFYELEFDLKKKTKNFEITQQYLFKNSQQCHFIL